MDRFGDRLQWSKYKTAQLKQLSEQARRAPRNCPDAFDARLQLPERVYIVGSGPRWDGNGIPADAFCIALNKAIERPEFTASIWGCFAMAYRQQQWWIERVRKIKCPRVFGDILHYVHGEPCEYSFHYLPSWPVEPYMQSGVLRTGATIAGAMLQLCYHKGVKEVVLAGVDMYGAYHFDEIREDARGKQREWTDVVIMNDIISVCAESGMKVTSLSKTALKVEYERAGANQR